MANAQMFLAELKYERWKLTKRAENNFVVNYEPDETKVLEPELASWYRFLFGMLRWIVDLSRVDTINGVSLMSPHI